VNGDLTFALALADAADAITMQHYQSATLAVRTKSDKTPVSEADEAVERMIRERVGAERPGTASSAKSSVIAVRHRGAGSSIRSTGRRTTSAASRSLRRSSPSKRTAASPPASSPRLRWRAAGGRPPATARSAAPSAKRARSASPRIDTLEDAHLTYDSLLDFDQHGGAVRFLSLMRRCTRSRGFGDFWAHMLVAEGAVEIAIEPAVAIWDMAAIQLIVEEAGGRFTDMRGDARIDSGSALSTNGAVHDAVLEYFR
jgi:histidinol-phosphatase